MPDSIQTLLQDYPLIGEYWFVIPIAIAGLLVSLRTPLHHWRQDRQIARAIKRLGAKAMKNVHIPDGIGAEVVIEYLLLTREAILVVDVNRFSGLIFGGEQTDQWTQVINKCSYRFPNPDHYLQQQIGAIRTLLPKTRVDGIHLFTHDAEFPKDKPPGVLQLKDIRKEPRRPKLKDIPKELRSAWEKLNDHVSTGRKS
jgi:hypothetical protein